MTTLNASANAPTIVLIHGGWHTPVSYSKLISGLQATGLEVHCPLLPSMNGTRPPNADLYSDTTLVRGYVESLVAADRSVIAAMHSYGGQVGSNALTGLGTVSRAQQGKKGGVSHLIYMSGFALLEGGSMVSKVKEFGHEHLLPIAFDFAEDDGCVSRDPKTLLLGPGLSDQETGDYLGTLVRWNGKCMYQPIQRCAWREIPVTYIMTTQDMTVPWDYQKDMVQKVKAADAVVDSLELATGHCANATMTQECVDVVTKVATGTQSVKI